MVRINKKHLIKTKHIDEGVIVSWEEFIDMDDPFKKQFVEEVITF